MYSESQSRLSAPNNGACVRGVGACERACELMRRTSRARTAGGACEACVAISLPLASSACVAHAKACAPLNYWPLNHCRPATAKAAHGSACLLHQHAPHAHAPACARLRCACPPASLGMTMRHCCTQLNTHTSLTKGPGRRARARTCLRCPTRARAPACAAPHARARAPACARPGPAAHPRFLALGTRR